MRSIGVRDLRQNASAVLRDVERGASFEITDRGRAVALLTPLGTAAPLERLRASGEIEPSHGGTADLPPPLVLAKGQVAPSLVLARLREHER